MINFTPLPLWADRWTAFNAVISFIGLDLTGATMAMEIRLTPDTPGTALISLANAASSAEGLALLDVITVDGVTTSLVQIRINESSMEAPSKVPPAPENGDDVTLAWDIHLTPNVSLNPWSGGLKQRYLGGDFIVRGGTTGVNP